MLILSPLLELTTQRFFYTYRNLRNVSEARAMWIGKNRNSLETPLGLEWCSGVKTLGIYFSCDQEQVIQQNFHDKLNECQKLTNLWKLRGLSLFGKVAIIKSFLIPKLLYVSSIIETPPEIIKQMEKMMFKFLWKGPDKVTRLSVINTLYREWWTESYRLRNTYKSIKTVLDSASFR